MSGLPTNAPGNPVLVSDLSAIAKVAAVTSSSRLKYPLPPFAGMGGLKFTSPLAAFGAMLVKVTAAAGPAVAIRNASTDSVATPAAVALRRMFRCNILPPFGPLHEGSENPLHI